MLLFSMKTLQKIKQANKTGGKGAGAGRHGMMVVEETAAVKSTESLALRFKYWDSCGQM